MVDLMDEQMTMGSENKKNKHVFSAFDPNGPNRKIYNQASFDSDMLKSFSSQISKVAEKSYSLYKKKQRIKSRMDELKRKVSHGEISQDEFEERSSKILKGYDEYKVYAMYDDYISYLVSQMKQYSEGIFSYIDAHKFDIPIVSETDEEKELEKDIAAQRSKKTAKGDKGWESSADEFAKRRKVGETPLMDKIAQNIYYTLFPKKKINPLSEEKGKETDESSFKIFLDWFLGKNTKSYLDKNSKARKKSSLDKFIEERAKRSRDVVGKKTAFSKRFKNIRRMHLEGQEDLESKKLITKKDAQDFIERLNTKKEGKKVSYKPASYTALANVLMRDMGAEVVNAFPIFFKNLYKNLRFANIHILSNTYSNVMIFTSIIAGVGMFFLVGLLSLIAFAPLPVVLANSFLAGILGLAGTFMGFNMYPKALMKTRARSIDTNLPFAIDHMAAVTSAGVNPTEMFKLLSESDEYKEVSVELEKIVEFSELFGYDLTTAIEKVSLTCPSKQMRDFFESFISNIESGGELKDYLRESADQAMLNYKLERQKYTESISTFSDIYTGLMVASPLFFVAALSMVSILGGTIGNMDVNTLMLLGTYVAIPGFNLLFIVLLEITQPSI
ncbi:MAG: type II secretion system F family protein [Candidatus Woesearchaeota archaeon]